MNLREVGREGDVEGWNNLRDLLLELDLSTDEAAAALGVAWTDICLLTNGQLACDWPEAERRARIYAAARSGDRTDGNPTLIGRSRTAEDGATEYEVRVDAGLPIELLMWARFATEPAPPLRFIYRDDDESPKEPR